MAQILVVADSPGEADAVVYRERVVCSDFESSYFSSQFAERVGWAVLDADQIERKLKTAGRRSSSPPPASRLRRVG